MAAHDYEIVARVGKARGLEGKVTARLAAGLPFCIYEGLRVQVVPPSLEGPRELTVAEVERSGEAYCVLAFEQVASIDMAEGLAGAYLLAACDDLDLSAEEAPGFWLGRTVIDEEHGTLGTIDEVIENPVHDVWVVHGVKGEVLIPAVDEFVLDVGEAAEDPILTRVPPGVV